MKKLGKTIDVKSSPCSNFDLEYELGDENGDEISAYIWNKVNCTFSNIFSEVEEGVIAEIWNEIEEEIKFSENSNNE